MNLSIGLNINNKLFYTKIFFLKRFCKKVLQSAWFSASPAEVSVLLTSDKEIKTLNAQYRHLDKATNVLSFPLPKPVEGPWLLGDIVVAYETVLREAKEEHRSFKRHLAHMLIHGMLHLQGYDHIKLAEAQKMERKERDILMSSLKQVLCPYQIAEQKRTQAPESDFCENWVVCAGQQCRRKTTSGRKDRLTGITSGCFLFLRAEVLIRA